MFSREHGVNVPHLGEFSSEGMFLPLVHPDSISHAEKQSMGFEVNWVGVTSWLHYLHIVSALKMSYLRQSVNPLIEPSSFSTLSHTPHVVLKMK